MSQILEFKEIRSLFGITENNGFLVEEIALHNGQFQFLKESVGNYFFNH